MAGKPAHPPVVDLTGDWDTIKHEVSKQLMQAATTTGFFYVKADSMIPNDLIERLWEANDKYFAMTAEMKAKMPQLDWNTQRLLGYEINTDNDGKIVREAQIMQAKTPDDSPAWPPEELVPGFKETTKEFINACPAVVDRIMSAFAIGLGWPEDYFKETTDAMAPDNYTVIQCNKYPPVEGLKCKAGTNRITAHTDESLITLLLTSSGSAGLELAAGKDGKAVDSYMGTHEVEAWHPCPHLPGCITVNVGDSLQMWSDGVLKSNFHRVRMPLEGEPQGVRYSLGYFVWPNDNDVMQGPKKVYPAINHREFMNVKSKGYAAGFHRDPKVYESVQHIAFGFTPGTAAAS